MKPKAFTIIEILVVLAILGIISSLIYIQTNNVVNSAKDSKRKSDVALLASGIHVYSIGSELIASSGCNIGSTCSTEINDALTAQLGPLPSEPDSNKSYVYQSDGTDCTISAVLSDGQTYQYSCSQDAMTQSAPINGQCGSCAATYLPGTTSFPSSEYCVGTVPSPNPVFPSSDGTSVSWSCPGQYLGSPTTCTAYRGQNGVCGTNANTTSTAYSPETTSYPSSDYCSTGDLGSTPGFPGQGSSSSWVCNAKYAGANASCTAYRGQNGVCGTSANGSYYTSSEITNTCSPGTAVVSGSGSPTGYFTWTCPYVYTGSAANCTANLKVNGQCGGANGGTYFSPPTSNLCNPGTASASGSWSWTCYGLNGGSSSGTCSANYRNCSSIGAYYDSSCNCCRLSGSGCPSGWTFSGWSTTANNRPNVACGCWFSGWTGYHSWSQTPVECSTISYWVPHCTNCGMPQNPWDPPQACAGTACGVGTTSEYYCAGVTEVGCY